MCVSLANQIAPSRRQLWQLHDRTWNLDGCARVGPSGRRSPARLATSTRSVPFCESPEKRVVASGKAGKTTENWPAVGRTPTAGLGAELGNTALLIYREQADFHRFCTGLPSERGNFGTLCHVYWRGVIQIGILLPVKWTGAVDMVLFTLR
jgi:hypothetical protein